MKIPPEKPLQYKNLIDGKWIESESGERYQRESPAHDVPVGEYPLATTNDADAAIAAARRAFDESSWPKMKGVERAKIIAKVGERIRQNKEELGFIETLESGKAYQPSSIRNGMGSRLMGLCRNPTLSHLWRCV